MSRTFCVPAILFLFCALILNVLITISLPAIPALDIVRVERYRLGVWGFCHYEANSHTCSKLGFAYGLRNGPKIMIPASLTRNLIAHPLAAAITLVSFLFAFCSTNVFGMLLVSLLSLIVAIVTIVAFMFDIIFYQHAQDNIPGYNVNISTATWITLVASILLLLFAFTTGIGCQQKRKLGKAVDALENIKKIATIALHK